MSRAEYEQKQRLMALAKAHTAQLMNKMDSLAPEERQAFLQSQVFKTTAFLAPTSPAEKLVTFFRGSYLQVVNAYYLACRVQLATDMAGA